jgi:hypothetical protein
MGAGSLIPFISSEDLGAYLEAPTPLNPDDLIVLISLDAACQAVRDALHRGLNYSTETDEIYDGSGTDALVLKHRPIVELVLVKIDGDTIFDSDDAELDSSVVVDAGAGILYLTSGSWWPSHRQNITVTYAHGYALNESDLPEDADIVRVPASIRLVALKLAAAIYRSKGPTAASGAVTEEHIGTYQYRVEVTDASKLAQQFITPEDMNTIMGHRNAVLA